MSTNRQNFIYGYGGPNVCGATARAFRTWPGTKDHRDRIIVEALELRVELKDRRESGRAIGDDDPSRLELWVGPTITPTRPRSFRPFDSRVTVEVCSSVDRHGIVGEPPYQVPAPIQMIVNRPGRHASLKVSSSSFGKARDTASWRFVGEISRHHAVSPSSIATSIPIAITRERV